MQVVPPLLGHPQPDRAAPFPLGWQQQRFCSEGRYLFLAALSLSNALFLSLIRCHRVHWWAHSDGWLGQLGAWSAGGPDS